MAGMRAQNYESINETHARAREKRLSILALLFAALVWGVIWYPYRLLRDAGIDGIAATTATYAVAFLLGLVFLRHALARVNWSWNLLWLAVAAGGCNLGYVLATLNGEVVRVLLLFYLAPLWTIVFSRVLLGERLNRFGVFVIALSLTGAATILWQPRIGLPVPHDAADWLGLGAGASYALFNVLSKRAHGVGIEVKSMVSFAGAVCVGGLLMLLGAEVPAMPASATAWGLLGMIACVLLVVNLVAQYGLAHVAANRAIVIMLSEVGFAVLSSWWLANEVPGLKEWVGGSMIVAASVFSAEMEH